MFSALCSKFKKKSVFVQVVLIVLAGIACNFGIAQSAIGQTLATDAIAFGNSSSSNSSLSTSNFSTKSTNELLLAFVAADGSANAPNTVSSVSGAGLTWTLVQRTNAEPGVSEIWRAFATTTLRSVTVTATLANSAAASVTVVTFTGANAATGATASAYGAGLPTASLNTTQAGSWVFGVGNDWDNAISRTVGSGQTMVNQYLATVGDTFWIQRQNGTTPSPGTTVTINDTAPAADRYNLALVEVLPSEASQPLTITSTSLPTGTLNVAYSATLTASGGTPPYTWSISGALPDGLTLNPTSGIISGTPTATGIFNFTVQATDSANPQATASQPLSITISASATAVTIWPSTAIPGVADSGPDNAVELGVKFKSDVAGSITGIRFYKGSGNTGTHVGNLWSSTGTLLASATFSGETASGWQQVNFTTPVSINANTVYVASYHTNVGHYSDDQNYFASAGVDNPPLHALANGVSGGDGVYAYGSASAFPNQTWNTSNYWVDVVFTAAGSQPLAVSTATMPGGAVGVAYSTTLAANGGTSPYTWTITSGTLPAGLTLDTNTGVISGTPTTAGTFNFTAQVSDSTSPPVNTTTKALSITVVQPISVSLAPTYAAIQVGGSQQFTAAVVGSSNQTVTWTVDGGAISSSGLYTAPSTTDTSHVVATSAADPTKTATATVNVMAAPPPPPTTIFYDDFTGTALNSNWTVISRHGEYAQNETECNIPSQVAVAPVADPSSPTGAVTAVTITTALNATQYLPNGTPNPNAVTCGDFNPDGTVRTAPSWWPYITGNIQWSSFNFTYGTVEIRAKFPDSRSNTWPATWLLGSNCQATNPYTGDTGISHPGGYCPNLGQTGYTEIDMTECYNTSSPWCQFHVANPSFGIGSGCDAVYPIADNNWHIYNTIWTASSIEQYVDGVLVSTCNQSLNNPMFLIIQTQTGGVSGTPNQAYLPSTLSIDYVKVTQP